MRGSGSRLVARAARVPGHSASRPDVGLVEKSVAAVWIMKGCRLVAAAFLVGWVVYLAATLPRTYTTGHWRLTWVGFDCALAPMLAATALLALWRPQLVILTSAMAGSLLLCDAWFDTTTAAGPDRWLSFMSVPVETILAVTLLSTAGVFLHHLGSAVPAPSSSPRPRFHPLIGTRPGGLNSTIRSLRGQPSHKAR